MNIRTSKKKQYDVMTKTIMKNVCKFNKKSNKTRALKLSFKKFFLLILMLKIIIRRRFLQSLSIRIELIESLIIIIFQW